MLGEAGEMCMGTLWYHLCNSSVNLKSFPLKIFVSQAWGNLNAPSSVSFPPGVMSGAGSRPVGTLGQSGRLWLLLGKELHHIP